MVKVAQQLPTRVLLVDGDAAAHKVLVRVLESQNHVAALATSPLAARQELQRGPFDVVLIDLDQFGLEGFRTLSAADSMEPQAQLIAMADQKGLPQAIEATHLGAFGYLTKPFGAEELLSLVERTAHETEQQRQRAQSGQSRGYPAPAGMVGDSPAMQRVYDLMQRVAATSATVLVVGETGTGKELVARGIHDWSSRASQPFVAVNCSALPETLLESELFGHTRGSFTGAISDRRGLFEQASGGTLFLDEISTISRAVQVKLLRVLQDRRIQRVGGARTIVANFRLVAASNADLAEEVLSGRFRADLYYRLNVYPIEMPPLRQRVNDIPLLLSHFRARFSHENSVSAPDFAPETMARLVSYPWPGNVRELENFVERAVIMNAGRAIMPFDPPLGERVGGEHSLVGKARVQGWSLERLEREYILDVLEACRGRRAEAASTLGIDRRTLYRKLKEYGVDQLLAADPADLD